MKKMMSKMDRFYQFNYSNTCMNIHIAMCKTLLNYQKTIKNDKLNILWNVFLYHIEYVNVEFLKEIQLSQREVADKTSVSVHLNLLGFSRYSIYDKAKWEVHSRLRPISCCTVLSNYA